MKIKSKLLAIINSQCICSLKSSIKKIIYSNDFCKLKRLKIFLKRFKINSNSTNMQLCGANDLIKFPVIANWNELKIERHFLCSCFKYDEPNEAHESEISKLFLLKKIKINELFFFNHKHWENYLHWDLSSYLNNRLLIGNWKGTKLWWTETAMR